MQASDLGRIIGVILAIGLVVFIIIRLASFAANVGNNDGPTAQVEQGVVLEDHINDTSEVVMTYDGPVIAKESHRQVRITVSEDRRIIEIIRGYDGKVDRKQSFKNTPEAYRTFMRSLNYAGYTDAQQGIVGDDETGFCPNGHRTIFEINDNNEEDKQVQIMRRWSTSCGAQYGTYGNDNPRGVRQLFVKQIPSSEYREIIRGVAI